MFNFIKNLFKKEEVSKEKIIEKKEIPKVGKCENCPLRDVCIINSGNFCNTYKIPENYNSSKKTILLIDDNLGILSFLEDDVNEIFNKYNMKKEDFNIIKITGRDAPIHIKTLLRLNKEFKVDYAIIDLTFGGIIKTTNGNIKLNGVDVYCDLHNKNKEVKFVFFTGNTLNPYIKSNQKMIETFNKCNKDDIMNYIINKNEFDEESRIDEFYKRLFKE